MKNILLFFLFLLTQSIFSQNSPSLVIDLENSEINSVDKVLNTNWKSSLVSNYRTLLEMSKENIYLEFHLAFGSNIFLNSNLSNYPEDGGIFGKEFNGNAAMLLKYNLVNPKKPYLDRMKFKIEYIRELQRISGNSLSSEALEKITEIEKDLVKYSDTDKYYRFSVGCGLPTKYSIKESYPPNVNYGVDFSAPFHFEYSLYDTFIFLGYDLNDLLSLETGVNFYANRLFLNLSLDITTPIIGMINEFRFMAGNYLNITTNTKTDSQVYY